MSDFIKLTQPDGKVVWVRMSAITRVGEPIGAPAAAKGQIRFDSIDEFVREPAALIVDTLEKHAAAGG